MSPPNYFAPPAPLVLEAPHDNCLRGPTGVLHMHDPHEPHLTAVKRILQYL
jgi:hypothetical protein